MDDLRLGEAVRRIREDPAAEDSRALLGDLMAGLAGDIPKLTSVDLPRVRGLARLLDDTAALMPPAERAAAKEAAAAAESVAAFLAALGRAAGDPDAW
jgi:hypothetical protein